MAKRLAPELTIGDPDLRQKVYQAVALYVKVLRIGDTFAGDRATARAIETIRGLFRGVLPEQLTSSLELERSEVGSTHPTARVIRGGALRAREGEYAPAQWPLLWRALQVSMKTHAGKVTRLMIEKPASESAIRRVESMLGVELAGGMRNVFRTVSADVHVEWRRSKLPADIRQYFVDMYGYEPPEEGELRLSLAALPQLEEGRMEWAELYPDARSREGRPWKGKLAFQRVSNGDLLAVDLMSGKVVYLDHEAGEMHGRVLAPDFETFITCWSRLGCVGPEWWSLEPFMTRTGLQDSNERAHGWRYWLGIENW
jgi:hypothetical protein